MNASVTAEPVHAHNRASKLSDICCQLFSVTKTVNYFVQLAH